MATTTEPERVTELARRAGFALVLAESEGAETVAVSAPDGQIVMQITLGEAGPRILIQGTDLCLQAVDRIRLKGRRVEIEAEEDAHLTAGGHVVLKAAENVAVQAGGALETRAFCQNLHAEKGDFSIKANDDVFLDGERIRMNSPRIDDERTMGELKAKRDALIRSQSTPGDEPASETR